MDSVSEVFDKIWGSMLSFDFVSDFLDIIFVTFIVFEAIKLIRGSRTFHLIKGIVILFIAYFLVKLMNMEATEYLLSMIFKNALLILVVLFAPEIRNVLEKFGRSSISDFSFFNFKNKTDYDKEISNTVNDFCKAAGELSESKTGALVVFEKDSPLKDIINSGTVLDAQSSPELFNGLFFKNSALHDGAVVVRNARIYAAGCILPLTQETDISSELGTRHRAALGMSEQSDAIVVVVSEETGAISVAVGGKLRRTVKTGQLRQILLEALVSGETEKKKKRFGKNKKDGSDGKNSGGEENE